MTVLPLQPRPVVAAAILDSLTNPTRLLATARAYPASLRGLFEFPGGKVEPGELWQEALQREIFEELSLPILLGAELSPPGSEPAWPILQGRVMRVWFATPHTSQTIPHQGESHMRVEWIDLERVNALPWLPSNQPIVERLLITLGRRE